MIVFNVDIERIAVLEGKGNPIVSSDRNAPGTLSLPFKFVKIVAGQIQIADVRSCIDRVKPSVNLLLPLLRNLSA